MAMINTASLLSMFRCRLCWTITGAVFASILVIEAIILVPSYWKFQREQLAHIEATGLLAVKAMFVLAGQDALADPDTLLRYGERLVQGKVLRGAIFYTENGVLLGTCGESFTPKGHAADLAVPTDTAHNKVTHSPPCTKDCIDVTWSPTQVGAPFTVLARLDSAGLQEAGVAYIRRILGLILLIATFVTVTTMSVLSRLVLSPILLLRRHMILAGEETAAPLRHLLPDQHSVHSSNELGAVCAAFNDMLKRLAESMLALHTANETLEQRVAERTADLQTANRVLAAEVIERSRAEAESLSLARFPGENSSPVLRADGDGMILYANPASNLLLDHWQTQPSHTLPLEWIQLIQNILQTGTDKNIEVPMIDHTFSVRLSPIVDAGYVNLYGTDITEKKEYEDQLRLLANYDPLTELPNRSLFQDRWQQAIGSARQNNGMCALLLIALDGCREIEQAEGKEAGNTLRKSVAQRLRTCTAETATVARLGGDLFALIHTDIDNATSAADMAQHVLTILSAPYTLEEDTVEIQVAVGISLFPSDGTDPEHLVHLADLAMSRAQADPRHNSYRFYEGSMNKALQERRDILRDLRWAVERGHLEIHYQPQIALADNRLIGMEALLRWRHPEKGLISPARFIPLAEESQLIIPIGLWVLQTACQQNKQWQEAGLEPLKVAVNLSSVQFRTADLLEAVHHTLQESGLDPQWLELEITESVAMEEADKTSATLTALHNMGLSIAIDDFGTGYSSLAYLKKFPVKKVKIDQSFVRDLKENSDSASLCYAIVQLGHSLNLQVIAEGVETIKQLHLLRDMGCDQIQGYYYSRPLDVTAFTRFAHEWRPE